jgi:muconolactone delta-isomerase
MLFLVLDKVKLQPVPEEQALSAYNAAQRLFKMLKDLEKDGKLKAKYALADIPGGIVMLDVESLEELYGILASMPTNPYVDREIHPLISMDLMEEAVDMAREKMMERVKKH